MFGYFLDPRYLLFMAPAFILMLAVQWYVKRAYSRWSQVPSRVRMSGAQAAERLIQSGGLYGVRIEGIRAGRWFNLAREVIDTQVKDVWIVDLSD